ncbi:MAG: phospholipid carrier-dependent glycosyltransferase [Candidatus Daviesbacteria bacterium]|nr:phospholipid carrier-dependent glycosyltransferase [Candidatus Daviesbacteria bacterium]
MQKFILLSPKYLLVFICIFFLFTRIYKISGIPVSVYWDEASIGYNAYSISTDLKDEWGKFLPIHFRAFGEFKLPVYIYAAAPFVKVLGLNAFSLRLPSVLFSLGVVILTYFLAKKLSGNANVGVLSSFFVSISPWFFIFSRTGYEATAGLMFYLFGIYLFLFNKKTWYIFFSIVSFILSAYSYNSFRIIIPLTLPMLVLLEFEKLKETKVFPLILSFLIIVLSIIPIYRIYKYDSGASRIQAVAASNDTFFKNYLSHFDPKFLILSGDKNLRSQQIGFGQLYLPELILLPLGILYLIKSKSKYKLLPIILLILGPIPAAITKESPHALRAISVVPFISIISATGVTALGVWIKKVRIINIVIVLIFFVLFTNYFLNFLNIYPSQSAKDWQYEYKKIYTDYGDKFDKYDRILISDKYAQPYIFTLFYLKYDPDKFRQEVVRNSVDQWGFSTVKEFGKFEFGKFPEIVSSSR